MKNLKILMTGLACLLIAPALVTGMELPALSGMAQLENDIQAYSEQEKEFTAKLAKTTTPRSRREQQQLIQEADEINKASSRLYAKARALNIRPDNAIMREIMRINNSLSDTRSDLEFKLNIYNVNN